MLIGLGLLSYFLTKLLLPHLLEMLRSGGAVKLNWEKRPIPAVTGLVFPMVLMIMSLPLFWLELTESWSVILFSFLGITLLGILDDLLGNHDQKGLKGHFFYLLKEKKLSTGALKAFGTGVLALYIVVTRGDSGLNSFLNWLLLVLSVNLINLLDLRPGRALKGTLILFLVAYFISTTNLFLMSIILGIMLAYAHYDFKGLAMLGDTGSNTLGLAAGLSLIDTTFILKLFLVAVLIILHILAEVWSFTKLIESNKILKAIDQWGRK